MPPAIRTLPTNFIIQRRNLGGQRRNFDSQRRNLDKLQAWEGLGHSERPLAHPNPPFHTGSIQGEPGPLKRSLWKHIRGCLVPAVFAGLLLSCSEPALPVGVVAIDGPPDCDGRCAWPTEACVAQRCVSTGRDRRLAIAIGANCLRAPGDALVCWGTNAVGQLGRGTFMSPAPERQAVPGAPWVSVSAGVGEHFMALDAQNRLWGWGNNYEGGLGTGDLMNKSAPALAKTSLTWAVIHAGNGHSCAQNRKGQLYCWGRNVNGELGTGDRERRTIPVPAAEGRVWSLFAVGWGHTCALDRSGVPWCWGRNSSGQLGTGNYQERTLPTRVATSTTFQQMSTNGLHTCAISVDNAQLWCWGDNSDGKLGTGDRENRNVPTLIAQQTQWVQITTSTYNTCGITRQGEAWCWGNFISGKAGGEDAQDVLLPMKVAEGQDWQELGMGHAHSCGLRAGINTPLCWGLGAEGQLGREDLRDETSPTPISLP